MSSTHPQSPWTDERVATAKKMWADGCSARQIAETLACGLSRNAVIGKLHRLGLEKRAVVRSPYANNGTYVSGKKPAKVKPAKMAAFGFGNGGSDEIKAPTFFCEPAPTANLIPLEALTGTTCRWPIGDPGETGFGFCGAHCAVEVAYCPDHQIKAYAKPPKAKPRPSHAETDRRLAEASRWAA